MSARVTRAASDNHSAQFPRHCFQRFGKRQYAWVAFALFQTDIVLVLGQLSFMALVIPRELKLHPPLVHKSFATRKFIR